MSGNIYRQDPVTIKNENSDIRTPEFRFQKIDVQNYEWNGPEGNAQCDACCVTPDNQVPRFRYEEKDLDLCGPCYQALQAGNLKFNSYLSTQEQDIIKYAPYKPYHCPSSDEELRCAIFNDEQMTLFLQQQDLEYAHEYAFALPRNIYGREISIEVFERVNRSKGKINYWFPDRTLTLKRVETTETLIKQYKGMVKMKREDMVFDKASQCPKVEAQFMKFQASTPGVAFIQNLRASEKIVMDVNKVLDVIVPTVETNVLKQAITMLQAPSRKRKRACWDCCTTVHEYGEQAAKRPVVIDLTHESEVEPQESEVED